jgi:hypothetical protein
MGGSGDGLAITHKMATARTPAATRCYDYTNNIGPVNLAFTVEVTNNYVSNSLVALHLNVVVGIPLFYTIQVDNTNYLNATTWTAYTSTNITANLGSTNGWHELWAGLKGSTNDVA